MTQPDDGGGWRLSEAERDDLAETLGRHFVAGRIDADALGERVEAIYAAESRDGAQAALADLPPLSSAAAPAPPRRSPWRRRHGEASAARAGWRPTPERFRDPTTDRVMRVWVDPADGSRHYVPEASG